MEIKYLGHASFLIKTKKLKIVTDPYLDEAVGFKFPETKADVVTISHSHQDHSAFSKVSPATDQSVLKIDLPGEFEKNGVRIYGYLSYHDDQKGKERGENILYKIETDEGVILHCGDLGEVLDDDFVDEIGDVDVLLIPVGGYFTIGPKQAVELISKIEPKIFIPMHYKTEKHNLTFSQLSTIDDFFKEIGQTLKPQEKLILKKEDLNEVEMKMVVLQS